MSSGVDQYVRPQQQPAAEEQAPAPRRFPQPPIPGFITVQLLGEGAFGEVLLIMSEIDPNISVAMKMVAINNEHRNERVRAVRKEYLLQERCSREGHQNVIRIMGIRSNDEFFYLFLEYADAGELFDKIDPNIGMNAATCHYYFRQLMCGLQFIHSHGVVHRDIKPENLLLTKQHVLKISDFGMATLFKHEFGDRMLDVSCGTIPYAAPEVIAGGKYRGPPIDVWSSGVVLIAMLTGELPWEKASDISASYLCWLDNSNLDEDPWKKIDVRCLCMLRKILTDNVDRRLTIEQVMQDAWYTHNYGELEPDDKSNGRTLKRRLHDNLENVQRNIACTQQIESSSAKRLHLETPDEKVPLARHNAWFSQPTNTDDLLLTQHIDMSQNNSNLLQRMVRRMTRFCVKDSVQVAWEKVLRASEHAGFAVHSLEHNLRMLVSARGDVSMMISLYTMEGDGPEKRVMIDFRRSRGDGLEFKKMFLEVRERMHDSICPAGNNWLANLGFVPKDPQFVKGGIPANPTIVSSFI